MKRGLNIETQPMRLFLDLHEAVNANFTVTKWICVWVDSAVSGTLVNGVPETGVSSGVEENVNSKKEM